MDEEGYAGVKLMRISMKILGCWKFSHRYQFDGDFLEGGEMLMILYW